MNSQIDRIVDLSRIRFGTSSFSSKDWVGPFYKPGTSASDFLRQYSNELDTVEIDSTYYSIPSEDAVKGWIEKIPEKFVLSAKLQSRSSEQCHQVIVAEQKESEKGLHVA
ncbi:MAG: DUF72 domain-containing protein [candidate division Zixibacteria bacterium]|nr:DUF72 domain-containing protein [candidate division Zixibacteria bacterium]MBU1470691.1 DUF72 domain-containing protein [candidate division Zixibacteria bacterium]MBU2625003.1 DUF72 domain-containing protein [candidate division Zixibacteria bacterium]